MKKLAVFLTMTLLLFSPVLAVDVTFCLKEWVWNYNSATGCKCNTGAGCGETPTNWDTTYYAPGVGTSVEGAILHLVDKRNNNILNTTSTSSCIYYSGLEEGGFLQIRVYNISTWKTGDWKLNYLPSMAPNEPYTREQYLEVYYTWGNVWYDDTNYWKGQVVDNAAQWRPCHTSGYGLECDMYTIGKNVTYINYLGNPNVTWRMNVINALTTEPVPNLRVSVNTYENYTNADGWVAITNVDATKDLSISWGGQKLGSWTGDKWTATSADNPKDLGYYEGSNELWVLNGALGASGNESLWIYHKNNGTLIRSMDLSEPSPAEEDRTGLAIDSYYMFLGNTYANNIARRVKDSYSGDWTSTTTVTCSSPKGLDISFLGGGVNDTDRYIYCNDFYKKVVYQYYTLNGTYIGIALNYSADISSNTYVYGITTNNIYMWLLTYNTNYGNSDVLQYGFDGTYIESWDTTRDNVIPEGIETDGTRFWIIFDDSEVWQYWRVSNVSESYEPEHFILFNDDSWCEIYGEGCDSICGMYTTAIPIDEDLVYLEVTFIDEDGKPVPGVMAELSVDQSPGLKHSGMSQYDGRVLLGELYRNIYTYTLRWFGVVVGGQMSGLVFSNITTSPGDINYNYMNISVTEKTESCLKYYPEAADLYWENGTVYSDVEFWCDGSKFYTQYFCNPGWNDSSGCHMGYQALCNDDCGITETEIWACGNGQLAQASQIQAPLTCTSIVYQPSQPSGSNPSEMSLMELVTGGFSAMTGSNPGMITIIGLGLLTIVPVAAVAYTGVMAVGMMSFVGLLALLAFLGIIPAAIIFMLGAVIVGYFFVTMFLNKGKGDRD